VHPLNDVSTVVKDAPDVFSVHCAGEMGITIVPSISTGCADPLKRPHRREGIHYHIWLCAYWPDFYTHLVLLQSQNMLGFLHKKVNKKQILFVQEENDRNGPQEVLPVVPDVLEEVEGLLQPVGLIVFPDHHVVAATGYHKDNGYLTIKTLNPLSAKMAAISNSLKIDFVYLESCLKNPRCQYSASQQVLISRRVVTLLHNFNLF
uniref:Uncharacterized protein n=1 Tax=Oncorhynchus kisutch TaxID=8019 RepID=A0A8C7CCN9_ONCKI